MRKTFHYLNVGDSVLVDDVLWDGKSESLTVKGTAEGVVTEVGKNRLTLRVPHLGTQAQVVISMQTGMEWGSEIEHGCYRIAPALARLKGVRPSRTIPCRLVHGSP